MKIQAIVILVLVALFTFSFNIFGSPLDKQILELKPQADRNKDGKLSDTEKKNLMKTIISRFPRSDSDGDGVCLLYTSPSPRDYAASRMPSSA